MHHAYAILGEQKKGKEELLDFLKKDLKFPVSGNPDLWQREYNVFKILDSRTLGDASQSKPVKHDRKIFIIQANLITKDAQNSLLKMFEEPPEGTIFFLLLPGVTNILPTLKSRLIFAKGGARAEEDGGLSQAEEFLGAKVGRRMQMITKIIKDLKDEKINKSNVITFIKNMEKVIKNSLKIRNAHNARGGGLLAVEDIEKAISYAGDESPSLKVILEHLAIVL